MPGKISRKKNRLAELRQAGIVLSLEQVGKLVGLNASTVSRHEGGIRSMTREQIRAYAALYGVPSHELFFIAPESEEPEQPEQPQQETSSVAASQ